MTLTIGYYFKKQCVKTPNIQYNSQTYQCIKLSNTKTHTQFYLITKKNDKRPLVGFLPEAGSCERNENPAATPVRACSVEPVKMCFVLRGSHCPTQTYTHGGGGSPGSVVTTCFLTLGGSLNRGRGKAGA